MSTTPAPRSFDLKIVQPIIDGIVADQMPLFHSFRDIGSADIRQECYLFAKDAHRQFRKGKGRTYSSWINRCIRLDLIDWYRKLCRRAKRDARACVANDRVYYDAHEGVHAIVASAEVPEEDDSPLMGSERDDETIEDWAGNVYRHSVRVPVFKGNGRKDGKAWYTVAQLVTAVIVMRRLRLDPSRAVVVFEENAELRAALRMTQVPTRQFFERAVVVAKGLGVNPERE